MLAAACTPDVHIHINNYYGDSTEGETDTDTGGGTGAADGTPQTSAASADSAPGDEGPPATSGPTTGPTTAMDDGSSSAGGGGENAYPAPAGGVCPEGTRYSQPIAGFEFCAPACAAGQCPAPASGDAAALCVFNPDSSNTPCEVGDATCQGDETCTTIPGGALGCALPPSHCALICSDGQTCSEGMECSDVGACQYPV